MTTPGISSFVKYFAGFAQKRSMPTLYKTTLLSWYKKHNQESKVKSKNSKKVFLFCDEFTNYNDTEIGMKAILLLEKLGQ